MTNHAESPQEGRDNNPSSPTPERFNPFKKECRLCHIDMNNIFCYEDAILLAIQELKDCYHNGSTIKSIQKHVEANLIRENIPRRYFNTWQKSCLQEDIKRREGQFKWNNILFLQALQSLLEKDCISNSISVKKGSCLYKLSHNYKKRRAEELKAGIKRIQDYKKRVREKEKALILSERRKKEEVTPVKLIAVPHKKHLVDEKVVTIVVQTDKGRKGNNRMDLDNSEQQKGNRLVFSALKLKSMENEITRMRLIQNKSLRDKLKVPRKKILVKAIVEEKNGDSRMIK